MYKYSDKFATIIYGFVSKYPQQKQTDSHK